MSHGFTEDEMGFLGNAGDHGGDVQVSDSMSRRFTRTEDDGTHTVLEFVGYLASETVDSDDTEPAHVQVQVYYGRCTDLTDPGSSETYADYRYWDSEGTTLDAVRTRITTLTAEDIFSALDQMGI
jgi:hypothetical protein